MDDHMFEIVTVYVLFSVSLVFLIGAAAVYISVPQVHNPCISWNTNTGKEFSPPSTEWYNIYCNETLMDCKNNSQLCGHYYESCACYRYKRVDLWHWENTQTATI